MKNPLSNIYKGWRTTVIGLLLVAIGLVDNWVFHSMDSLLLGIKLSTILVVGGLVLLLTPDVSIKAINKKIRDNA